MLRVSVGAHAICFGYAYQESIVVQVRPGHASDTIEPDVSKAKQYIFSLQTNFSNQLAVMADFKSDVEQIPRL